MRFGLMVLLLTILVGCGPDKAYKYNQAIVDIDNEMVHHIDQATKKFNIFYKDDNYDSLVIVSQEMLGIVEKKLEEIRGMDMPDVIKGEEFKNAALRYFSSVKNGYTAYKVLGMETNEEEREVKRQRLVQAINEQEKELKIFIAAQRKFAYSNNLKLQKRK